MSNNTPIPVQVRIHPAILDLSFPSRVRTPKVNEYVGLAGQWEELGLASAWRSGARVRWVLGRFVTGESVFLNSVLWCLQEYYATTVLDDVDIIIALSRLALSAGGGMERPMGSVSISFLCLHAPTHFGISLDGFSPIRCRDPVLVPLA